MNIDDLSNILKKLDDEFDAHEDALEAAAEHYNTLGHNLTAMVGSLKSIGEMIRQALQQIKEQSNENM